MGCERQFLDVNSDVVHNSWMKGITLAAGTAALFLLLAANSSAAEKYVDSTAGSDANKGNSPELAWRSIQRSNKSRLEAGDTLHLKAGSVWNEMLIVATSGTAEKPIRIVAYGTGAKPMLTGVDTCILLDGGFVELEGVAVSGCTGYGVAVYGPNCRLSDMYLSGSPTGVFVAPGSNNTSISNSEFKDNNVMNVLTKEDPDDDSGAFGVLIAADQVEVSNSTFTGQRAFSFDYKFDGSAVEVYEASHAFIHHNVAANNDTFVELGGSRSADNKISHNVVTSVLARGTGVSTRGYRDRFGPVHRTYVVGNRFRLKGRRSTGIVCGGRCSAKSLTVRKNHLSVVDKAVVSNGRIGFFGNRITRGSVSFRG